MASLDPDYDLAIDTYSAMCPRYEQAGLSGLTEPERAVFLAWQFVSEVNNGGFRQFLSNPSGAHAEETPAALEAAGLSHAASLIRRALAAILPETAGRQRRMSSCSHVLAALTDEFFASSDDPHRILAHYIRRQNLNTLSHPMSRLYPLRFEPIFRNYVWGGRRLELALGKELGDEEHYAESWEVVDHGQDQSRVAFGPLQGTTLGELVRGRGPELLGRHHPQKHFPLLFKYLDAQQNLSVQVHPNDEQAARLDPPDLGKTEAWVVLHAEPGSLIYAGLKRGFDRHALEREVNRATAELCLHRFEPAPGDCVFLPAGTIHALGAGLVVAEIQQASDTTYRLFDWNRLGADGKPRPLHVREALDTINYAAGPVPPQPPQPTDDPRRERLVECDKFILDRWRLDGAAAIGGDERFHILAVLEGEAEIAADPAGKSLRKGATILLPACCGATAINVKKAVVLDACLP